MPTSSWIECSTPPVQDVPRLGPGLHRDALSGDAEEILVQVTPERPPDRIVIADALRPLRWGVAFQAETAELDDDADGAEQRVIMSTRSDEPRMLSS